MLWEKSKKKQDRLQKQTILFNKKFKLNYQVLQPEAVQLETDRHGNLNVGQAITIRSTTGLSNGLSTIADR